MPVKAMKRVIGSVMALLVIMPAPAWSQTVEAEPGVAPAAATNDVVPAEQAEASPALSGSYSISLASRYLFQGIDYSEGKAVVNPQLDLNVIGFTGRVWMNHDLSHGVSNEYDISLERSWSAGSTGISAGYTYLTYPHRVGWDPSQEFYATVSLTSPLNPSLSIHYDFDAGNGSYTTLGLSHEFERPLGTVSLGANLHYQDHYYEASGIPSLEAKAGYSRSFGRISVSSSISRFTTWENGDFRDGAAVPSAWLFTFGVGQEF